MKVLTLHVLNNLFMLGSASQDYLSHSFFYSPVKLWPGIFIHVCALFSRSVTMLQDNFLPQKRVLKRGDFFPPFSPAGCPLSHLKTRTTDAIMKYANLIHFLSFLPNLLVSYAGIVPVKLSENDIPDCISLPLPLAMTSEPRQTWDIMPVSHMLESHTSFK